MTMQIQYSNTMDKFFSSDQQCLALQAEAVPALYTVGCKVAVTVLHTGNSATMADISFECNV